MTHMAEVDSVSVTAFMCDEACFHPYECGGRCIHCEREYLEGHDPDLCALCNCGDDEDTAELRDRLRVALARNELLKTALLAHCETFGGVHSHRDDCEDLAHCEEHRTAALVDRALRGEAYK